MFKFSKFKICILLVIWSLIFGISSVSAETEARVYFWSRYESVSPGSEFSVSVLLDSNEAINAFDLEINFNPGLEFLGFDDRNSIVNVWQKNPTVLTPGFLKLQGGLFGPFKGGGGEITKLNFRVSKEGKLAFLFSKAKFYLADGLGTEVRAVSSALDISSDLKAKLVHLEDLKDETPPILESELVLAPADNATLIVFTSRDEESGIKENQFRFKKWLSWSEWKNVENPLKVPSGAWALLLKAVNNSGGETQKTIYLMTEIVKKASILLGIILLIMSMFLFYNKRKHVTGNM